MRKNHVIKSDIDKSIRIYACDFETTTASIAKDHTKVWSFAVDEIGEFKPEIYGSIDDFFRFCGDPDKGVKKRLYFHNLKFDGEFILYEAIKNRHMITAIGPEGEMLKPRQIINNEIVYAISDVGQWYFISMIYNNCFVEIRDSLKILPMTLKQVGKSFCKKYKKSDMDYDNKSDLSDCSKSDLEYIKNDVLVLSEALDNLLQLHGQESKFGTVQSLTIGSACLQKFKEMFYGENKNIMIKLDETQLNKAEAGADNMDTYIRNAYRGGYCYVNETIKDKEIMQKGFTADVNSLYPYVMCTDYSKFVYPYGKGKYCKGRVPDKMVQSDNYYFYARIIVSFRLKDGFVPTIQKKNTYFFPENEYLKCSAIYDGKEKKYVGRLQKIELTLAKDDYILFFRHYDIVSIEYLDYIAFMTAPGLCDEYVKFFEKVKIEATEEGNLGERTLAKLFSNNLYGQFAKSDNSSFKTFVVEDDNIAHLHFHEEHKKRVTNIAIGAAVTAHARYYQISTIQNNKDIFCYSDTDSLHCIGDPEQFKGRIHNTEYGAYKIENTWTRAKFIRQKTYIEMLPDGQYNICCAGMTAQQKEYFTRNHVFSDFEVGLFIPGGKLQTQRVPGGIILKEVDFTLNKW